MAGKQSAAVERALKRVDRGEKYLAAALKEGCDPSSVFRALARRKKKAEPQKKK